MIFTNHIFYRLVSSVNNNNNQNYHASYASSGSSDWICTNIFPLYKEDVLLVTPQN